MPLTAGDQVRVLEGRHDSGDGPCDLAATSTTMDPSKDMSLSGPTTTRRNTRYLGDGIPGSTNNGPV